MLTEYKFGSLSLLLASLLMSLPIKSQSEDLGGEAVKNMNSSASEEQLQDSCAGPPSVLLVDGAY